MALTITAAVNLATNPPRVLLTVDTTGYVGSTLVIYRMVGSTPTPVRSAETTPAIGDVTWVGYDYEAPFGQAVTYQVVIFTGGVSVASATSASTLVDETNAWLIHPGDTSLSIKLSGLRELGTRKRQITQSVQRVLGRADPIVMADARSTVEASFKLGTSTLADVDAMAAVTASGVPLLLNIPVSYGWGVTYEWCAVGDLDEARVVTQVGARPNRLFTATYIVVARPEGNLLPPRTWANVLSEEASWSSLLTHRATWQAVLLGA